MIVHVECTCEECGKTFYDEKYSSYCEECLDNFDNYE